MRERAAGGGQHSAPQHTGGERAAGMKEGCKHRTSVPKKGTVEV